MKTYILLFLCSLSLLVKAQAPKLISYQGVARGATGAVLVNQPIDVEFAIKENGNEIFRETHSLTTNAVGLFNVSIGSVNTSSFSAISWTNPPYNLEVYLDPAGGGSPVLVGSQNLISVPYALFAEKAGSAPPQNLSINSNSLSISNGNTIVLPAGTTYTAGAGIDVTGNVITNTAPDQTVTISGTGVSGVYPNFTITPVSSPSTTLIQGSNVLLNQAGNTYTVSSVTPTLSVTGNSISINPGNTQVLPNYSLTQSGSNINLQQNGSTIATVTLSSGVSYTAGPGIDITGGVISNTSPAYDITLSGPTVNNGIAPALSIDAQSLTVTSNSVIGLSHGGGTVTMTPASLTYTPGTNTLKLTDGLSVNTITLNSTPSTSIVSTNTNVLSVAQAGSSFSLSPVIQTLSASVSSISISNGNSIAWPAHALTLATNTLSINGPGGNAVVLPVTPATTLTAGSNVTVSGSFPTYTVSAPNYVLGTSSNSITLTNGVNSSSVAVPVQPISLLGTTLTAGPTTNSVNLNALPSNWTVTSGVIYPTILTNSVGIGTSGALTDKVEINHASSAANTHLHLKQTGADAFSRIKFSNAVAPSKYWINSVTSSLTDNNSGFNVFYYNGTIGRNLFTVAGDGKVSVNPFSMSYPALFEVNGAIEMDSTFAANGLNATPPVSGTNAGKIYYDRASNKFKVSENGSAWINLLGTPSPWAYNPGVLYPLNNPINDKVAIGSSFANSFLDVQAQAGSTVTASPLVNIENFNSSLNTSGLLRLSNTNGSAALIFAVNSHTTGDGIHVNMTNSNNGSNGIELTHQGIGNAGYFEINNTSSSSSAVIANSNASGPVVKATQNGLGEGGNIFVNNTSNANVGLRVKHMGVSDVIYSEHWGTSGRSGVFVSGNGTNTSPGLYVQTAGLGHGGFFEVIKPTSTANSVAGFNYGTGASIYGNNQGTGPAGEFVIPGGTSSSASALKATTFSTGFAFEAASTSGTAIQATNSSSTSATIYANNAGTGNGIFSSVGQGNALYAINNSSSTAAVYASNSGAYDGLGAYSNQGRAIYAQTSSTSGYSGIEAIHYGSGMGLLVTKAAGSTGGSVANFNNASSSNGSDAVMISNAGAGISLNVSKAAGTTNGPVAVFLNNSTANGADAVVITNNGAGSAIHAISGPTVTGGSNSALWIENGHMKATASATNAVVMSASNITGPTITASPAAGFKTTDVSGAVNINFSPLTNIGAGQYVEFRVTFLKPYASVPKVIATCRTYPLVVYVSGTSLNDCQIVIHNTGANPINNVSNVIVNYFIME